MKTFLLITSFIIKNTKNVTPKRKNKTDKYQVSAIIPVRIQKTTNDELDTIQKNRSSVSHAILIS